MAGVFTIRDIEPQDCAVISAAFVAQGWDKPVAQYERYYAARQEGVQDTLVAFIDGDFAGYTAIKYESAYAPFREQGIPEISDFNVRQKYQRRGLGAFIIKACEERILKRSDTAGIGMALLPEYGAAQRLYCRLGYLPDGRGIAYKYRTASYGDAVAADDDLVLWMTKKLR